jgi:hypothetical protein
MVCFEGCSVGECVCYEPAFTCDDSTGNNGTCTPGGMTIAVVAVSFSLCLLCCAWACCGVREKWSRAVGSVMIDERGYLFFGPHLDTLRKAVQLGNIVSSLLCAVAFGLLVPGVVMPWRKCAVIKTSFFVAPIFGELPICVPTDDDLVNTGCETAVTLIQATWKTYVTSLCHPHL